MNRVIKLFEKGTSGNMAACLLMLLITVAAELLVFNHHFFSGRASSTHYVHQAYELPAIGEQGARAVVMSSDNNELTLNSVNLRLANIAISTDVNDDRVITLSLQAREINGEFVSLGTTRVNPSRYEQKTAVMHLNHADSDKVFSAVRITAASPNPFIVGITKIEFNVPEQLNFSWLRVQLIFAAAASLFFIRRYRIYLLTFDESRRTHRALNYSVVAFTAAVCTFFFWATSPYNTKAWAFDFHGDGIYSFNNTERTMLRPLPETVEENNHAGPYEQLLSAMLKGKVSINVFVDPGLSALENPWDPSARDAAGTRYTWDRPYYNGQYFVYFGLAPLIMVYAPCYFLTGMVPSPALSVYLISLMAMLAVLWAYRVMVRVMVPCPNLLMYLLVQAAALSGTLLWLIQIGMSFYYMPYLACMTWLSVYLGSLYSLFSPAFRADDSRRHSPVRTRLLLLVAGISIPMLVWSRPLSLAALLALSIPAIILLIRENYTSPAGRRHQALLGSRYEYKRMFQDALYALLPVMAGAVVTMYYNYVRFESVYEFGQNYQLTGDDVSSKGMFFGWAHLRNVLYFFMFEPLDYIREFPFLSANIEDHYDEYGNMIIDYDRVSLFSIPIFWSLFLIIRSRRALMSLSVHHIRSSGMSPDSKEFSGQISIMERRMLMLKITALLTAFAMVFLAYTAYYNAAVMSRYLCEIATAGSYLAVVIILLNTGFRQSPVISAALAGKGQSAAEMSSALKHDQHKMTRPLSETSDWSSSMIYGLTVFVLIKSLLIGLLLPFTSTYELLLNLGTAFNEMNPGLILDLYRAFTPFGH